MTIPDPKRVRAEPNLYDELGVDRTADTSEIQKSYRRLALTKHPDRNGGTEAAKEAFQQLTRAYQTLVDPVKRHEYDVKNNLNFVRRVADLARRASEAGQRGAASLPQQQPLVVQASREDEQREDLDDDDDDDDDEEEEYAPTYIQTALEPLVFRLSAEPPPMTTGTVRFYLRRESEAEPWGLLLNAATMRLQEVKDGSASVGLGIPHGAKLVAVDETLVTSPQDVAFVTAGKLAVSADFECEVQVASVLRSLLLSPTTAGIDDAGGDSSALSFAPSEEVANCRLLLSGADGVIRVAPTGFIDSLRSLGGSWTVLRGRRVLAVGSTVLKPPVTWDDAPHLVSSAVIPIDVTTGVHCCPASIAQRRHYLELTLLCDETRPYDSSSS